jgi:peroxiredoxin
MASARDLAATVGCLAALGVSACGSSATGPSKGASPQPAPHYTAREMGTRTQVSLDAQRGHPVLLTSFAPWCTECRGELPQIQALAQHYGARGLRVLGVSVDEGSDAASSDFARGLGVRFALWHDSDHRYQVAFQTVGVPQTELIDAQGRLVRVWRGAFDTSSPETTRAIERVLSPSPSRQ